LLMQSAGLLIICHMREETSEQPTNFTHDAIVEDRFIGRIDLTLLIVRTVDIPVKCVANVENCTGTADGRQQVALAPRLK
jgi:hypothetical protein